MSNVRLYPETANGHPLKGGYRVIAQTIAPAVSEHLPKAPAGLVAKPMGENQYALALVKDGGLCLFDPPSVATANRWNLQQLERASVRQLASLQRRGVISEIDPQRFGPQAITSKNP